jgi:uncharacterized protein (TIGR02996 family)
MRRAFLEAICAAPEDDTPRLVFADWLDDNGEPERAEFIRVQCALARLRADTRFAFPLRCDPRRDGLEARQQLLLARHGQRWLADLPIKPKCAQLLGRRHLAARLRDGDTPGRS